MSNETAKCNDQPATERSCPDPAGSRQSGDNVNMKVESKKVEGITSRGTKGFRFESNLEVGMRVRTSDDREGTIGEDEIAGMKEVCYDEGGSDCWMPHELEILSVNTEDRHEAKQSQPTKGNQ